MNNANKNASQPSLQPSLTLKEWVYATDGKGINELLKISFLEFYFMKKSLKKHQNA